MQLQMCCRSLCNGDVCREKFQNALLETSNMWVLWRQLLSKNCTHGNFQTHVTKLAVGIRQFAEQSFKYLIDLYSMVVFMDESFQNAQLKTTGMCLLCIIQKQSLISLYLNLDYSSCGKN